MTGCKRKRSSIVGPGSYEVSTNIFTQNRKEIEQELLDSRKHNQSFNLIPRELIITSNKMKQTTIVRDNPEVILRLRRRLHPNRPGFMSKEGRFHSVDKSSSVGPGQYSLFTTTIGAKVLNVRRKEKLLKIKNRYLKRVQKPTIPYKQQKIFTVGRMKSRIKLEPGLKNGEIKTDRRAASQGDANKMIKSKVKKMKDTRQLFGNQPTHFVAWGNQDVNQRLMMPKTDCVELRVNYM